MIALSWKTYRLDFIKPARTSRGEYNTKDVLILELNTGSCRGVGEASPLPDLSIDGSADLEKPLIQVQEWFRQGMDLQEILEQLTAFPSLQFALDSAWRQVLTCSPVMFDTAFTRGEKPIPINGLVWMEDIVSMENEALRKAEQGFSCIKFKVGAQDHDAECRMLENFRKKFSAFQVELRLDANGAYSSTEVHEILNDLHRFGIHSIEQPVKAGQWELIEEVCRKSKIPVALDEELIGVSINDGPQLLKAVNPAYIILKPGLLGGFANCDRWIGMAEKINCGWWATSALESNVGLGHIAQWVSAKNNPLHQGLGTGALYKNNFPSGTRLKGEQMWFLPQNSD